MKSELVVIICIIISEAFTLKCYEVLPPYEGTVVNCTDLCSDYTAVAATEEQTIQSSVKTCGSAVTCTTASLNIGYYTEVINARCCGTDLCNTHELPVLEQKPNGKKCFFCNGDDCSGTVNCVGIEENCIKLTDEHNKTARGCASAIYCENPPVLRLNQHGVQNGLISSCCTGNLCNTSETLF